MPLRDVALTALVFGALPFLFTMPHYGAYLWAWISIMNPHRGTWGFAGSIPFAMIIALATLAATLFAGRKRHAFPLNRITVVYILFLVWMSVTTLFAINAPAIVTERLVFVLKIHVMMFVTLMLLRGRKQIEGLVWVVVLSLGFYGIKGGVFTALTGGDHRVWGPPMSMVEGNNELAVGLIMLIPLMAYLYQISRHRALRWFLLFAMIASGLAVLGTHSRGAFLAIGAMVFMLGIKSKRYVLLTTLLLGLLLAAGILFMPEHWTERMRSIADYQQDISAMQRIYAWKTLWAMALDRPLVGGGFATDTLLVFMRYAPAGFEAHFAHITPVAHSIYFQALGEHGFPGLALYLALGVFTWRTASRLARETAGDAEFRDWVPMLMKSIQVSIVGFAVGGAFLNLLHFDVHYYIIAFVVLVDATVREHRRDAATATDAPTVAGSRTMIGSIA